MTYRKAMIPQFTFSSPESGLPRQLVPIRLVQFIVGMDTEMVVTWLSNDAGLSFPPLITAWAFDPAGRHRRVRSSHYERLHPKLKEARTPSAKLSLLPRNHFVYSDDLASAFTVFIDTFLDREIARDANMGLEWDADVGRLKRVVDQSPDFNSPNATAAMRAATKIATAKRNQEWKAEVEKIQQTSNLNHSAACRAFAKWPGIGASAETIRRVTK